MSRIAAGRRAALILALALAGPAACAPDPDPPAPVAPLTEQDQARLAAATDGMEAGLPEVVHGILEPLLAREPVPARAQWLAGQAAYSLALHGEAVERLEDAVARDADAFLVRSNALGFAHFKLGDFPAARRVFTAILERAPDTARAHYGLGQVLLTEGDLPGARAHLERALELQPGYLKALHALARVLDAEGRHAEALALCEEVVRRWPSHEEALYLMSTQLVRLGRDAEAEAVLARRAQVYAVKERIGQIGQNLRAGHDTPAQRLAMAECYLGLDDVGQAAQVLRAALARFPDDAALRAAWDRLSEH